MSIHNGHRQRLKERFLSEGLDSFEEHEVLELLLFYCIPRKDTNTTAHNLLNRFGSLAQVMDASVKDLETIDGIGNSAAVFLKLIKAAGRAYRISGHTHKVTLNTTDECGAYLVPFLEGSRYETIYLLSLDAKCMLLNCQKIGEGNINSANIHIRDIVDMALSTNATSVVLAHNHPSGIALPSHEDIRTTNNIARALSMVDVILMDHIIVADGDYVSMTQSGLFKPILPNGGSICD